MKSNHKRVLVLNADYTAWSSIDWQRAMAQLYKFHNFGTIQYIDDELEEIEYDSDVDLSEIESLNGLQEVDFYKNDYILSTGGVKWPVPAVCRMPVYQKPHSKTVPFSRKNIFIRDALTCQYCGFYDGTTKGLTYDHVYPRSKWKKEGSIGTPTHWENIVTCCIKCNRLKGDLTLKEANMTLLKTPCKPNAANHILGITPWSDIPDEWIPYLPKFYRQMIERRKQTLN